MALVFRNGRPYLYTTEREGGKCVCRYGGSGETALLCARLNAIDREKKEAERYDARARLKRLDKIDKRIAGLSVVVDALVESTLTAAGWHRPGRHNWRKRRHPMSETTPAVPTAKSPAKIDPAQLSEKEVRALIDRAQSGDKSALPTLKALLDLAESASPIR